MGLLYYPRVGEIIVCHYDKTAPSGEMIKSRPVVVIGPRLRRRGNLVGVIPLSTTEPISIEDYHCRIELEAPLPRPFDAPVMWAKCDMYSSVSLERLDRFRETRPRYGGARKWTTGGVSAEQITALKTCLLCGLGLGKS